MESKLIDNGRKIMVTFTVREELALKNIITTLQDNAHDARDYKHLDCYVYGEDFKYLEELKNKLFG